MSSGTVAPEPLPVNVAPLPPKPDFSKVHDRVTVVENVYWQRPNSNEAAKQFSSRYHDEVLTKDGQPYVRDLKAGETPTPLAPHNWNQPCGLVRVDNREGTFFPTKPSEAELTQLQTDKMLYIGIDGGLPALLVPPGKSIRVYVTPAALERMMVRCNKGEARYTVVTFPL